MAGNENVRMPVAECRGAVAEALKEGTIAKNVVLHDYCVRPVIDGSRSVGALEEILVATVDEALAIGFEEDRR